MKTAHINIFNVISITYEISKLLYMVEIHTTGCVY